MESIIDSLEEKVRKFKSTPSQQLMHDIESLLRDLKSRAEIPDHFKARLSSVICTFIVEKEGPISNVTVKKSVDPSLDKEACRVLRSIL